MSNNCSETHQVTFLPDHRTVEVPAGTPLLEAAAAAGLLVEAECGGRGTCGSCLMEVTPTRSAERGTRNRDQGTDPPTSPPPHLPRPPTSPPPHLPTSPAPRLVYACQTVVDANLTVTPLQGELMPERRRIVTGTSYLLEQRAAMAGPDALRPLCRRLCVMVPAPSLELCASDRERLVDAARQAAGVETVSLDLAVLRRLPRALREDGGRVTVTLWLDGDAAEVMDLRPGEPRGRHLGVACDLGTSTVVLKLLDLDTGSTVAVASDYNRQVRSGADVISRIDAATRPGGLARLRDQAVTTINVLLRRVLGQNDTAPEEVQAMVVSGNTTMIHLLLGVEPRYIREEPYVPAFAEIPPGSAAELGLQIHPRARVYCLPAVGSFVGGDIVSGVLCQRAVASSSGPAPRVAPEEEVFLLVDVGTNGEIVLGGEGWMLCCACSAGPAFEGAGVSCGMRSTRGAVERIQLRDDGEVESCDVIGGARPRGLCGSALIQLLGELLRVGLMDRGGRLRADPTHPRITRVGRVRAYVVERGARTQSGRDLLLTEHDIDNLVRAKGAVYSGCSLLLAKVGLTARDLDTVYIAGGFGRYLAVDQATAIGMLPDLPAERFAFLGNTSLAGACLTMLSTSQHREAQRLARAMTYVELSAEPGYMDEYTSALFLPHTDLERFPRATRRTRGS